MRYVLALLIGLSFAGRASAGDFYIAAGGEIGIFETFTAESYTDFTLTGRIGYDFGEYVGVEAEGAINLGSSDTVTESFEGGTREFSEEITSRYGLFLRGRIPASDGINFFARAGLGARNRKTEFRQTGTDIFNSNRNSTFLFGALGGGAEFNLSNDNAIRTEYTFYSTLNGEDTNDVTDSVFSLTYVKKF